MDNDVNRLEYLRLLKIPVWQKKSSECVSEPNYIEESVQENFFSESLPHVHIDYSAASSDCNLCQLSSTRTQVVEGVGRDKVKLLVITEAPTVNEDLEGKPLTGEAYQLFLGILQAIGLTDKDIYITPYVKCSPYQNFITSVEADSCFAHLQSEFKKINPESILLLGRNVSNYLLKTKEPFNVLRGQTHKMLINNQNINTYVSFNPYQLLKFPEEKKQAWQDYKRIYNNVV